MDRAPAALQTSTPRCVDCAHYYKVDGDFARCAIARNESHVTGELTFLSCTTERGFDVKGACGTKALHFVPSAAGEASRSARRFQQHEAIQQAIVDLNPDAGMAQELLDALSASLEKRYEDAATDAMECAQDFRNALGELDSKTATLS